uniref:C1orf109 homolog n=1 Tax=Esox lucius TaxID=8010 RepID=C1BZU8_ESOLU|nr:C1orf109 homolog [Esox lucius]
MSKSSLFSLNQVLKKCFQNLENNQKVWNSALGECTSLVGSLGNLVDQLRALEKVKIVNTPLHTFPDLQERLNFKLLQALDIVLVKLADKLCSLQQVRDAVSNQVSGAFQLYEHNIDTLDLATCTQRSAIAPSIADMLEWLKDAERYYRQQFLRRKNVLQALRPEDLYLLEAVPKRWESLESPSGEERLSETLFTVSFFMESQ